MAIYADRNNVHFTRCNQLADTVRKIAMENLKIEYLPIEALKPYEKNARKHQEQDISAIVASIKEFGYGMSSLSKIAVKKFGLEKIYKQCKVPFNKMSNELFYAYLYDNGIRMVREYEESSTTYIKNTDILFINA